MSQENSIKVPVVQFGNKREYVEVPQGSTYQQVKDQIQDADNKYVCVQGESIDEYLDKQVDEETTVFISPKKIAQGIYKVLYRLGMFR